jgi:hypothetical protein
MIQFVLAKTVLKFGLVNKPKGGFKGTIHTHFFDQATVRRIVDVLTGQRVAATGIGPQTPGMVFVWAALLEEQLPNAIKNKDGKSSVKQGFLMGLGFGSQANFTVFPVHQNHEGFFVQSHAAIYSQTTHEPRSGKQGAGHVSEGMLRKSGRWG